MRIERPRKDKSDYFEILVPEPEDWAELIDRIKDSPLSTEKRIEAATRYMRSKLESKQDG